MIHGIIDCSFCVCFILNDLPSLLGNCLSFSDNPGWSPRPNTGIGQTDLGRGQGGVWCDPTQWQNPYFGLFGLANTHILVCSVWPIHIFQYKFVNTNILGHQIHVFSSNWSEQINQVVLAQQNRLRYIQFMQALFEAICFNLKRIDHM